MKNILVLGAGRSAVTLIKYLLDHSKQFDWRIKVADYSYDLAKKIVGNHPNAKAIFFNVNDQIQREKEIISSNIVISMLPALKPRIMPVLGSNTDIAIKMAVDLIERSRIKNGHIILVTDEIEGIFYQKIKNNLGSNRLSIFSVVIISFRV